MRYVMVLLAVAVFVLLAAELGLIPPFFAHTRIKITEGQMRVTRGELKANASEHLSAVLREAGVRSGSIAISSRHRIHFSKIPPEIHQRIRNVLLNQWH